MPASILRLMSADRATAIGYGMALTLGVVGGWAAASIGSPLPWFIGPMVLTTIFALGGAPVRGPNFLRPLAMPVLGVVLGSAFLVEVFTDLGQWMVPLGMIPVFILVSTATNYLFFRRVAGLDKITSFLSGVPGGLTDMILLGEEYGGDARQIALAHSMRVLVSVLAIALFVVWFSGTLGSAAPRPVTQIADLGMQDAVVLLFCAAFGPAAGRLLRMPARMILGALLLSALAHLTGLTRAPVPTIVSYAAQLVLGTSVGTRFAGIPMASAARSMGFGFASSLVSLAVSAGMAYVAVLVAGIDYVAALLGYAPGGMMEMSLLALVIHQSVAYVSVAHIIRYVVVMVAAVSAFKLFQRHL